MNANCCTAPISQLYIATDNSSTSSSDVVQTSPTVVDRRRGGHRQRQAAVTFVAGSPLPHVRCVVAGGFPPPSVSMFLDQLDITHRFNVVRRSSLHGVPGLQVFTSLVYSCSSCSFLQSQQCKRAICMPTVLDPTNRLR